MGTITPAPRASDEVSRPAHTTTRSCSTAVPPARTWTVPAFVGVNDRTSSNTMRSASASASASIAARVRITPPSSSSSASSSQPASNGSRSESSAAPITRAGAPAWRISSARHSASGPIETTPSRDTSSRSHRSSHSRHSALDRSAMGTSRGSAWEWRKIRESPPDCPLPGTPRSYTATPTPRSLSACAVDRPTIPAPTTATSARPTTPGNVTAPRPARPPGQRPRGSRRSASAGLVSEAPQADRPPRQAIECLPPPGQ